MIVGDFNTSLSPICRSSRKEKQQGNLRINNTIDQMDLTDIYRVSHPGAAQYTFLSATHGTLSKIHYALGHKTSLNKLKKIEITPFIPSGHSGIILELNNKRNYRKYSNTRRLNNKLLNDYWATGEVR
jgi:hypothetical protein